MKNKYILFIILLVTVGIISLLVFLILATPFVKEWPLKPPASCNTSLEKLARGILIIDPAERDVIPPENKIDLQAGSIDTRKPDPYFKSCAISDEDNGFIIQFKGPILTEWRNELAKFSVIINYLPQNSFLVKTNGRNLEHIQKIQSVQWVGFFYPAYKLRPSDFSNNNPADILELTVLTYPNININLVASRIIEMGGEISSQGSNEFRGKIRVTLKAEKIKELMDIVDVIWIERYSPPTLNIPQPEIQNNQ